MRQSILSMMSMRSIRSIRSTRGGLEFLDSMDSMEPTMGAAGMFRLQAAIRRNQRPEAALLRWRALTWAVRSVLLV